MLASLAPRDFLAGYGEVMKYGLLGDAAFFAWLETNGPALAGGDGNDAIHARGLYGARLRRGVSANLEIRRLAWPSTGPCALRRRGGGFLGVMGRQDRAHLRDTIEPAHDLLGGLANGFHLGGLCGARGLDHKSDATAFLHDERADHVPPDQISARRQRQPALSCEYRVTVGHCALLFPAAT